MACLKAEISCVAVKALLDHSMTELKEHLPRMIKRDEFSFL